MAAIVHIAVGFSWIAQAEEEEHERIIKQIVVVLFCLLWGCIGAPQKTKEDHHNL